MGPRRSGKTVLSLQTQENNYYYINFDDEIRVVLNREILTNYWSW
ncbi:MAG TPA: hypothetical protein VK469_16925 [Candidatus Kapabacteria bacterium]|nr:hypothetical protein [Candidatus Kapabacteria bacterium]